MKKIIILSLLTLSLGLLTACGGKKASATSIPEDKVVELVTDEEEEARRPVEETPAEETPDADPAEESVTEEPQTEEASEEPELEATSTTVGDPDHPMAVDPTPYWEGDNYFNIAGYFYACGGTQVGGVLGDDAGAQCCFADRRVTIYGGLAKMILVVNGDSDLFIAYTLGGDPEDLVLVNRHDDIWLKRSALEQLFNCMDSIINHPVCPFAETGYKHIGPIDGCDGCKND